MGILPGKLHVRSMKLMICLLAVVSVNLHVAHAQNSFLQLIKKKLLGRQEQDVPIKELIKLKFFLKKMMDGCYDVKELRTAKEICYPDTFGQFDLLKLPLTRDWTEEKKELIHLRVAARFNSKNFTCEAEQFGMASGGVMSWEGTKNFIDRVVKKDLNGAATEIASDCFKLTTSCNDVEFEEQSRLVIQCFMPRLIPQCIKYTLEQRLGLGQGFEIEDPVDDLEIQTVFPVSEPK